MRLTITIILATTVLFAFGQDAKKADDLDGLKVKYKTLLDRSKDIPMGHAFVPSKKKPQGEIQLVKRGRAWVLQSIFYTKYPTRFLKEVKKKEAKAWPKKDMPGKADSDRYLKGLEKAIETIKAAYAKDKPEDKRRKLLVELVFSAAHNFVVFSTVKLEKKADRETIASATPIAITALSSEYLRREITLIAEDSFKYSAETSAEIFRIFPEPPSPEKKP
jgi:hypothetical protein